MNFTELPICLQAAYVRQPRRRSFASSAEKQNLQNNYLAEANPRDLQKTHGVTAAEHRATALGGRNAKGAGAPYGNHNAAGGALYRLCLRRIRLKQQLDRQHYQLLALAAAVEHLQARAASADKPNFSSNNYLAEAEPSVTKLRSAAAAPLPPPSAAITIILRVGRPDSGLGAGKAARLAPPNAAQILVESARYPPLSGWTSG